MVEIATSLLEVKEKNIVQTIYDLEAAKTDYFHIDVMDGKFVKKDTIEMMRKYTEYIKQIANTKTEVHLMVQDVEAFAKAYIDMGINSIIFHVEACKSEKEVLKLISFIKENGVQVGVSLNPKTPIESVYPFLPYIHKVLVMTVEAGIGGQELITETLEKVKMLNVFAYENGFDIDIEVDGGINDKTAPKTTDAGANILVSGSYIINSGNFKETIKKLRL